jgi:prepilin-type N-terminal cleavage/methylation domain-containing protein/prepilin-type processing-associated H-X9-DG protein
MKRGFTLIELLVVIAIIAILAAILFPVFARARDKANATACLSNLKQIVLSALMYVQDYDEFMLFGSYRYPDGGGYLNGPRGYSYIRWHEVLIPYMKSDDVLKCESYKFSRVRDPNSYGYNGYTLGHIPLCALSGDCSRRSYVGIKIGDIPNPSMIIMFGPRYCAAGDSVGRALTYYYCLPQAHNEGDNFAFCDGHAKWMKFGIVADQSAGSHYWTYWNW